MKYFISFIVGLIFSIGLGISGMTQTQTVKGFLDIFGNWNYNLVGVMAGAILVHSILYFLIRKRETPLLDVRFHVPNKNELDKKLILGAAIFGLGWGYAGVCPGPGIVALMSGNVHILIFVIAMILGMAFFKAIEKKI